MVTGAPFDGPIAGVRVGLVDGKLKAFATAAENDCLLYTSPSPRDRTRSRMPSSA